MAKVYLGDSVYVTTARVLPHLPITEYVRDRIPGAPGPTLSSHIATLLLTRSAAHAHYAHPALNPLWLPDDDPGFDVGTAAHAVILEGRALTIIDADNYRTKAAQAARDAALLTGGIPALPHQAGAVTVMAQRVRDLLERSPDLQDLGELLPERTYVWREGEAWCRSRPDWMTTDSGAVLSLKTTRASAEPEAFMRTILGSGYDTQAAFELAAVKAATGIDAHYVWIAVECAPPYACSLIGLTPEWLEFARTKFRKAVSIWAVCMQDDHWPSYPDRIAYMDLPPWVQARWVEQHGYPDGSSPAVDDGRPLSEQLFGGGDGQATI